MIGVQAWEIWLILLLQDSSDWLKPVMELFTMAGYPQAYMVIVAIIYWSFDRKMGLRMALFLPVSASLNSLLKQAFHAPRPFWVDKGIIAMHPENGFGMPSGHAQAATVWLLAGAYFRKGWFWIIAIVLAFGVGLSRAYLGVHFPSQIIIGWLLGIALFICFIRFESEVLNWFNKLGLLNQLLWVLTCSVLIFGTGLFLSMMLNSWEMPADWIRNASVYLPLEKAGLKSYGMASVAGNTGSFLGVTTGAIMMARKGTFYVTGKWWIRMLRIFVGLICMVLLYAGLQYISPDKSMPAAYTLWRFIGFYLIALSAVFLLPLLFIRLNLLILKY